MKPFVKAEVEACFTNPEGTYFVKKDDCFRKRFFLVRVAIQDLNAGVKNKSKPSEAGSIWEGAATE